MSTVMVMVTLVVTVLLFIYFLPFPFPFAYINGGKLFSDKCGYIDINVH